jgi:CRISPR-associated protein Cst1
MELFSTTPKVKALNLSYALAELLSKGSFREKLEKLTKGYYKVKGAGSFNLLVEFLERLIEGKRDYSYLFKLFRYYLTQDREKGFLTVGYYPVHLHYLNLCLYEAKANLGEKMEKVSEKELWGFYSSGQKLRRALKERGAENKINSLSFKLLNALKVGDAHRFMDILLRVYAGLSRKVPEGFVKTLEDREAFKSAGYSFVAGLLNETKGGENDGSQ